MMILSRLLLIFGLLVALVTTAYAGCGFTKRVWPGDSDGSIRLSYNDNDGLEVIYREEDNIIISRGIIGKAYDSREIYAIYDLGNNTLSYAKSRYSPMGQEQMNSQFSNIYFVQTSHEFKVFTASKAVDADIKAALAENREKACFEEVKKRWQGRSFDREKCGMNARVLKDIAMMLATPDANGFTELTQNVQAQRLVNDLRKRDCDSVQDVGMRIVKQFRKPETLQRLEAQKKVPSYLGGDTGVVEKTTVERFRY